MTRGAAAEKESGSNEAEAEPSLLTTGDMARLTGSTLRTVRFYEEAGLLCPTTRTEGGHRMFDDQELLKLQLILDLREACLSLCDIKELFALKNTCTNAEEASEQMSAILGRQIDEMQKKITKLRRLREELASTVSVIRECQTCPTPAFPRSCGGCEMLERTDLPRAVKLLWG
jgi:DNA-binding transcriptional MerR regulator